MSVVKTRGQRGVSKGLKTAHEMNVVVTNVPICGLWAFQSISGSYPETAFWEIEKPD